MSEQPTVPPQTGTDDEPPTPGTGTGTGTARPGNVRTQGETAVDEAIGTGDDVH